MDKREKISHKVKTLYDKSDNRILVEACTGSGKTKLTLDLIDNGEKWDIVVPNRKLILSWEDEIIKWKKEHLLPFLDIYCYQSLHKKPRKCNMVLDEVHKLTEQKYYNIADKLGDFPGVPKYAKSVVSLSAKVPLDKKPLLQALGITKKNTMSYKLDTAVEDDIVAPYTIDVIEMSLENSKATVTLKNGRMVTEEQMYHVKNTVFRQAMASKNQNRIQWAALDRMRFLYDLPGKLEAAKEILKTIPKGKKTIIFCASIKQADALCEYTYHSKTDDKDYNDFCRGKIDRLAVVNSVSEGVNIPELDYAFLVQTQSKSHHAIQKIGRLLRKTSDPGKIGKVFVLSVVATQDAKWVSKALAEFDAANINFVSYRQIQKLTGKS